MYKKIVLTFIFFSIITSLPYMALADAEAQVLEVKVNNAVIKVSYDQDKAGLGEPVPFTFELLQEDESAEMSFDSLWINIKPKLDQSKDLLAAEVKKSDAGPTSITYDFPQTGEYTFAIRYNRNDTALADHTFDFAISKDSSVQSGFSTPDERQSIIESDKINPMVSYLWIITLCAGIILGWAARTFIRKHKD
jgi:hypothetical protein